MTDADLDYIESELRKTTSSGASLKTWPPLSGHWANALKRLELLRSKPAPAPPPTPTPAPAPSAKLLTGGHFVGVNDYATVKAAGWDFVISEFQPQDTATMNSILAGLNAHGLKGIVDMYPPPYTLNSDKATWTITAAGQTALKALAADANVLALFVFNEPYWVEKLTIAQLRALRTEIQQIAPGLKIYHDIGSPDNAVNGGDKIGADQTGVCDYAGVWDYPFKTDGSYQKAQGLSFLSSTVAKMQRQSPGTVPVFLGQAFEDPDGGDNARFPTAAELADWNKAIRAALPADALISWYTWGEVGGYEDVLSKHPDLLVDTV